jgi:hypothetical protein
MSVLPLATLIAIANAGTIWPLAMETGERIHFQAMRRSYLEDVSKLPSSGEPRFAIWHWGGFVVGHAVVYDESDEIALPEQSSAEEGCEYRGRNVWCLGILVGQSLLPRYDRLLSLAVWFANAA